MKTFLSENENTKKSSLVNSGKPQQDICWKDLMAIFLNVPTQFKQNFLIQL